MNRALLRRRLRTRLDVESLESRYVLDASATLAALNFGPPRIDPTHVAPLQNRSNAPLLDHSLLPSSSADSPVASTPLDPIAPAQPIVPQVEIDVFRFELRDPFNEVREQFVEVITFQSFTEVSNRPIGSSPEESMSFASVNPPHSTTVATAPGLEQSSSQSSAARSEEASAAVASSRSDAAVCWRLRFRNRRGSTHGSDRHRRVADRSPHRPAGADRASATAALAADAVRPAADANVPRDEAAGLSTPGDLIDAAHPGHSPADPARGHRLELAEHCPSNRPRTPCSPTCSSTASRRGCSITRSGPSSRSKQSLKRPTARTSAGIDSPPLGCWARRRGRRPMRPAGRRRKLGPRGPL